MKRWSLLLLLSLASCSASDGASSQGEVSGCPHDLPTGCEGEAPSYAREVAPVIEARCVTCHDYGGVAASKPLGSYAELYKRRSPVLNQIYGCNMPPDGAEPLSAAERQTLLRWLVCNAPDN